MFSDAEILEAFCAFDLDKNNFVGAAEIRHVLVSINIGEQAINEMIRMVGKDGAGQVTYDEFYFMVTGRSQQQQQQQRMDASRSMGNITNNGA